MAEKRTKMCPHCGRTFETTYSLKIYCCQECKDKAYNERSKKKYHEEKELYRLNLKCKCCGEQLYGRQRKFCSSKCRDQYKRDHTISMIDRTTANKDKCACTIIEKCYYGAKAGGLPICDYLDMEGHARGCYPDGDKCTCFRE